MDHIGYENHQLTAMRSVLTKNIEYLLDGPAFNAIGVHTTEEQSGYRKAISDVLKVLYDMPYQQEYRYFLSHLVELK